MEALEVRIANGAYHGGVEVVDDAEVDSGEIVVQAVTGRAQAPADLELARRATGSTGRANATTVRDFHGRRLRLIDRPAAADLDRRRGAGPDAGDGRGRRMRDRGGGAGLAPTD